MLFARACGDRTEGNGFELKESRVKLDIGKFFILRVVRRHWNRLSWPRSVIRPGWIEL